MIHRLLQLLTWLILAFIFASPMCLKAQTVTIEYSGQDTLYLDSDCKAVFTFDQNDFQFTVDPPSSQTWNTTFLPIPTGYDIGDIVQGETIVNLHFRMNLTVGGVQVDVQYPFYYLDSIPPQWTSPLPGDVTITAANQMPPVPTLTADDNCTNSVSINYSVVNQLDTCNGGTFQQKWVATDDSGNSIIHERVITLLADNTPPTITVFPDDGQSTCAGYLTNYNNWVLREVDDFQATDGSDSIIYSHNAPFPTDLNFDCDTTFTVLFSATDFCNNTSSAPAIYSISDNQAPVLSGVPTDITVYCGSIPVAPTLNTGLSINDDCDPNPLLTFSQTNNQNAQANTCSFANYAITRTWVTSDHCGNQSTYTQNIIVEDDTAPVLTTVVTDTTITCNAWPYMPTVMGQDECFGVINATYNDNIQVSACSDAFTVNRTYKLEDPCNNAIQVMQQITVVDTVAPVFLYVPSDTVLLCDQSLTDINPIVSDDCDIDVFVFLAENSTQVADPTDCGYYNYDVARKWTITDNCGNTATAVQNAMIRDTVAPQLTCPPSTTVSTDMDQCEHLFTLPSAINLTDNCTTGVAQATSSDTKPISHPAGANANTSIVNPITLEFAVNLAAGQTIIGNPSLTINLINVDAEAYNTEYFNILSEFGAYLGRTNATNIQCGNSSTVINGINNTTFQNWAADGIVTIRLEPAGFGIDAINNICPNGRVEAQLMFDFSGQISPLTVNYETTNNRSGTFPDNVNLPQGDHIITYTVQDCSGNQSSCEFEVAVEDQQPPQLMCPSASEVYSNAFDCSANAPLELPTMIMDNCQMGSTFDYNTGLNPIKFVVNPNTGTIPDSFKLDLVNVPRNALSDPVLEIEFIGDYADAGEFFYVEGESQFVIGQTDLGNSADECSSAHTTVLTIPAATFNQWAADGRLNLNLIPNTDASNFSDFINPCSTLDANGTDGISMIGLRLIFDYGDFMYQVSPTSNPNQIAATGQTRFGKVDTITLDIGTYDVSYHIEDRAGLESMCSYTLQVSDTIPPVALATATILTVNPSGTITTTIDPAVINNGSYDNCELQGISISPSTFDCLDAGMVQFVTLTATDVSGNQDSTQVQVQVVNEMPMPSYDLDLCGQDTIYFQANPPAGMGSNLYTYQWTGPNSFSSQQANPVLDGIDPSYSGTYTIEITGLTGCKAVGSVQVQVEDQLDRPVISSLNPVICEGLSTTLRTQGYAGSTVLYEWYEGSFPNGQLVQTTSSNSVVLDQLSVGTYDYYVIASVAGCVSDPSLPIQIQVIGTPIAQVVYDSLKVCDGESFQLEAQSQAAPMTYHWSGPDGFAVNQQNPASITASMLKSGNYIHTTSINGCTSDPDTTFVVVRPLPAQPFVITNSPICQGDSIRLYINNASANDVQYEWTLPQGGTIITDTTVLVLPSQSALAGNWSVRTHSLNCTSLERDFVIEVNSNPQLTVTSDSPICEGSMVQLAYSSNIPVSGQKWSGPNNYFTAQTSPTPIAVEGVYHVEVTAVNGCITIDSVQVSVHPKPVITALSSTSDGCFNGEDVQLCPTVFPPDMTNSYQYEWTGPNNLYDCCSQSCLTIPNASETNKGNYVLKITNEFGCISNPRAIIMSGIDQPAAPLLSTIRDTVCAHEDIVVNVQNTSDYSGQSVVTAWFTPSGVQMTGGLSLLVTDVDAADKGTYRAVVSKGGCPSDTSGGLFVTVNPVPSQPSINTNAPICEGTTLKLETSLLSGLVTYEWAGPNGFTSQIFNPVITNVSPDAGGDYYVQVVQNGCASPLSSPSTILINPKPPKPVMLQNGPICMDYDSLILSIDLQTQLAGAEYTWFKNGNLTYGPGFDVRYKIDTFPGYADGNCSFTAMAQRKGCFSEVSDTVTVTLNSIPNNSANAGQDIIACDETGGILDAIVPTVGTGSWEQVCGPAISLTDPLSAQTNISDLVADEMYCFAWNLSNGACTNYSTDTVNVTVSHADTAYAGLMIDTCYVKNVRLAANPVTYGTGQWSQSQNQANLGVTITDIHDPNTQILNMIPGSNYSFQWSVLNNGCGNSQDNLQVRIAASQAFAGPDQVVCTTDDCFEIDAAPPIGTEVGTWSSPNDILTFNNSQDASTLVCNLQTGDNILVWHINDGVCGEPTIDTMILNYQDTPIAEPDNYTVNFADEITMDITANDVYYDDGFVIVIQQPAFNGVVEKASTDKLRYIANNKFIGTDQFVYKICSKQCPGNCSTAIVTLEVGEDATCEVHNTITPNGDFFNDEFIIPCLLSANYPKNSVSIFNQWGDEVFYQSPYMNGWDGTYNGTPLPTGTYYYVIDFGENSPDQAGFIHLQR